jgi:hypothetical protein
MQHLANHILDGRSPYDKSLLTNGMRCGTGDSRAVAGLFPDAARSDALAQIQNQSWLTAGQIVAWRPIRPLYAMAHQQREAIARSEAGEALTDIARTFGVSHTTIGRLTSRRRRSVRQNSWWTWKFAPMHFSSINATQ